MFQASNIYNLILMLSSSWDRLGGASGTRWPREALQHPFTKEGSNYH